jgi:hypothetical protein
MRFKILALLCLLIPAFSLRAEVPRKIAVLELEKKGTAGKWTFLSRSLPQQIEIALDRTEKVMVIRKYLWKEVLGSDASVISSADVSGFASKAGVEAVVYGSIEFGQDSASVSLKAFDAARGTNAAVQTFVLPYSDAVFSSTTEPLTAFVAAVTQAFPPLTESETAVVRKKVKVVYQDLARPAMQFRLYAAPVFTKVEWFLPRTNYVPGDGSEGIRYLPAIRIGAGYQFRIIDLEAIALMSFSPSSGYRIVSRNAVGVWLFKDMIKLSLRPVAVFGKTLDTSFAALFAGFGLDFKPSDEFQFGLTLGPSVWQSVSQPGWPPQGYVQSNGMQGFMSLFGLFEVTFEMKVWKNIFAEFAIGAPNLYYQWMNPSQYAYSMFSGSDFASLGLVWKKNWGSR